MCGICGVLRFDDAPDPRLIQAMMVQLAHRGPDGSGYFRDHHVALGHTRLAVIDAEGGAQPMCNENGDVWVTFNGEIFNYVELRKQLRGMGHVFRSTSDTEVIVHAWEQWGPRCFEQFNGQWAMGIWDRRSEQLVLSRDRLGVRPLYLARRPGTVLFASEVKALFADASLPRQFDPSGINQVLTFWSTVAPTTVFQGVEQIRPGHYAVIDRGGMSQHAYWEPEFPARGREVSQDLDENAAELRDRLVRATTLRFRRSDVPVGAYLSGGIDSAVTAAIIANFTSAPLRTFSVRFADSEFDEGRFQREMTQRLGTNHQEIVVSASDVGAIFPEVVSHAETPILRAAPAPFYLLSKLVHESGFKVVVTGEGADEVLAGYDIFREARVRLFWSRDPESPVRSRAAELLYPWMRRSPNMAPAFARGFFGRNLDPEDPAVSHRPRWDSTAVLRSLMTEDVRRAVPGDPAADLITQLPPDAQGWDPLSRAQWLEMKTLLAGYILASQGDRMLMANSVEGRFPFLDREVVEFANALPARHKLSGLDEKHLLKRAFADLVPEAIRLRDKQPYRAPDSAPFFTGAAGQWLHDAVAPDAVSDAGVFQPAQVERLLAKGRRSAGVGMSNTDNMRLLAVVSTQLLHQQFIASAPGVQALVSPPEPMTVVDFVSEGSSCAS